jgi:hypothetical protein
MFKKYGKTINLFLMDSDPDGRAMLLEDGLPKMGAEFVN